MNYKVIFHAFIEGKRQNLDATFFSERQPKLTDKEVIIAVMNALSSIVEVDTPIFSIEFHIEAITLVP